MAPVETEYYDLLGVATDVNDTDLKKAYRKAAMKYHPDKNPSPDAEEMFKEMSKAYQVLSDPNLRTVYDKNGKKMVDKEGGVNVEDAAGFFANVFGGERFNDYIGEISLMKEMTSVASTMMTDEEKAELDKELNGTVTPPAASPSATPAPGTTPAATPPATPESNGAPSTSAPAPAPAPASDATPGPGASVVASPSEPASGTSTPTADGKPAPAPAPPKKRGKLTPEQRKQLEEHDRERKRVMEDRIKMLTQKLVDRLRPFVDAKAPGAKDDPETQAWETKMRLEADDLKLESFGVEVRRSHPFFLIPLLRHGRSIDGRVGSQLLQAIGTVYITKATSFLKSRKFLGIPGFWSRLKEKGAVAKDAWGVIGSALSVQQVMQDMERVAQKGEAGEEELKALEADVTGKILLASWRGTRFEVVQVLREVVDNVLKEPGVSDKILYDRARGLLLLGAIFKSTEADETDVERRELERMVAEAARPKRKSHVSPKKGRSTPPRSTSPPAATSETS
ncbi:X-domain of DnaJ-containing-domain-containing protein [Amylostereum chailletii]|nr:X-domain of DnaJ-containing-domain-containing protein [Amylostereum chailletii]